MSAREGFTPKPGQFSANLSDLVGRRCEPAQNGRAKETAADMRSWAGKPVTGLAEISDLCSASSRHLRRFVGADDARVGAEDRQRCLETLERASRPAALTLRKIATRATVDILRSGRKLISVIKEESVLTVLCMHAFSSQAKVIALDSRAKP